MSGRCPLCQADQPPKVVENFNNGTFYECVHGQIHYAETADFDLERYYTSSGSKRGISELPAMPGWRGPPSTPGRAGHQRPDKLEVHVEICQRIPEFTQPQNRSKSVQYRFTYERSCLVCDAISYCPTWICAVD